MKAFTTYQKITKKLAQLDGESSFIFTKDMFDNSLKKITLHDLILRKSERHISYGTNEKTPFVFRQKIFSRKYNYSQTIAIYPQP